ncbi:MAG: glutamine--fructose-6-phosphate transaminase (isomerizing), partial [Defluviitaleaceae bacterium]|nr:glutamine--fructose-6-phosphate transaminase (isomerizing) [Defluviitaleaceae bacterium]
MCGIVGYIGNKDAVPILIYGLSKLEYRGYDSAGVAVYSKDSVDIVKTKGRLAFLEDRLLQNPLYGNLGIGHTRWATHGAPSDINSHPHVSKKNKFAVVHNGIIENYMHLKDELKAAGYSFASDTDTETVAHLIDFYYKEGLTFEDAVFKAIERIEGSYALAIMCEDFPDKIIAARKDSPLIIGLGEDENFVASDVTAILNYTRNVHFLGEKEVAVVKKDSVEVFDKGKNKISKEISRIDWDIEAAEKGGYDYFMLKEINEQAKVVRDTLAPRLKESHIELDGINIGKKIKNINKIYMVACGTAFYASLIGKSLIEKYCRIPVIAEVASEFRYNNPLIDESSLVILVSQSGETADTLAALRLAKSKSARVLAVVNVVGSTIAREADDVLYTHAGPEIAVASTKAFSAQVAAMYLVAIHFGMELDKILEKEYCEYKTELEKLPSLIDNILTKSHNIEELA